MFLVQVHVHVLTFPTRALFSLWDAVLSAVALGRCLQVTRLAYFNRSCCRFLSSVRLHLPLRHNLRVNMSPAGIELLVALYCSKYINFIRHPACTLAHILLPPSS